MGPQIISASKKKKKVKVVDANIPNDNMTSQRLIEESVREALSQKPSINEKGKKKKKAPPPEEVKQYQEDFPSLIQYVPEESKAPYVQSKKKKKGKALKDEDFPSLVSS